MQPLIWHEKITSFIGSPSSTAGMQHSSWSFEKVIQDYCASTCLRCACDRIGHAFLCDFSGMSWGWYLKSWIQHDRMTRRKKKCTYHHCTYKLYPTVDFVLIVALCAEEMVNFRTPSWFRSASDGQGLAAPHRELTHRCSKLLLPWRHTPNSQLFRARRWQDTMSCNLEIWNQRPTM